jgi:16S rRNA processing protein RimM
MSTDDPVVLGRVSGPFGIRGWVKIFSYTDPKEGILDYPAWQIEKGGRWQPVSVAEGQPHGKTVIARFEGVEDRDAALDFMRADIGVFRKDMPEAGDERYYWSDLEGLRVEEQSGDTLGVVAYLLETGANDVMVIERDGKEILVPFVIGAVVKDVDLAGGVIRVDWEWD